MGSGFTVQGLVVQGSLFSLRRILLSRISFHSLTLLVGYQVLNETSNGSAGATGIIIHILLNLTFHPMIKAEHIAMDFPLRLYPGGIEVSNQNVWV